MHGLGRTKAALNPSSSTALRNSRTALVRILHGQHGCAEQAGGIGGAVPGQPVVVGGSHRGGRRGIGQCPEIEADGGVQDRLIDALGVHVGQTSHRIGASGLRLGQRHVAGRVGEVGAGCCQGAEGNGQDLLVTHRHVLEAMVIPVDGGPVDLRYCVPGCWRLDDVAVGVDHRGGDMHGPGHGALRPQRSAGGGSGPGNPPVTAVTELGTSGAVATSGNTTAGTVSDPARWTPGRINRRTWE